MPTRKKCPHSISSGNKAWTWKFESPFTKKEYELKFNGVETIWCTCPSMRYKSGSPATRLCKHVSYYFPEYTPLSPREKREKPEIPLFAPWPEGPSALPRGFHSESYVWSEKFDGVRAIWTGDALISRSGQIINVPPSFTKKLPKDTKLDGELWAGQDGLQTVVKAIQAGEKDPAWTDNDIQYLVFDIPSSGEAYQERYDALLKMEKKFPHHIQVVEHHEIEDVESLRKTLSTLTKKGSEGIVLRNIRGHYQKGRSGKNNGYKWKITQIGDGRIIPKKSTQSLLRVSINTPKEARGKEVSLVVSIHDQRIRISDKTHVRFRYNGLLTKSKLPRFPRFESVL